MPNIEDVLTYLRPNGGWVIWGQDFNTIYYDEGVKPITKKELEKGFADYDEWKISNDASIAANKKTILDKLGLTADEAKLLIG